MSQRSLRNQVRDAEARLAYLRRLADSALAIGAHAARGNWPILCELLDAYVAEIDSECAKIDSEIVAMIGRMRKPIRRRVR